MRISKNVIRSFMLALVLAIVFVNTCFAGSSSITDSYHNCVSGNSDYGIKVFQYFVSATENYSENQTSITGTSRNLFLWDYPNALSGSPSLMHTVEKVGSTQLLKLYSSDYISGNYWLDGDKTYYMYDDNTTPFYYDARSGSSISTITTVYSLSDDWSPAIFTKTDSFTIRN